MLPISINNVHILCISSLHQKATNGDLFQIDQNDNGIKPYLIDDKGYMFLRWLMIAHKHGVVHHIILKLLFNKDLHQGKNVVEYSFGILKKTFRKLLLKTNLDHIWCDVLLLYFVQHDPWKERFRHKHGDGSTRIGGW